MEGIKRRSLFLVVIALLLAAISAALIFMVAPKRVNAEEEKAVPTVEKTKEEIWQEQEKEFLEFLEKADKEELAKNAAKNRSAEITDYSGYRRITSGTITNICGKIIVFNFSEFSFNGYLTDTSSANKIYVGSELSESRIYCAIFRSGIAQPAVCRISEEDSVPFGENYVGYFFPNNIETIGSPSAFDLTTMEFNISVSDNESKGVYWYELSDEEPTEPEPEEPTVFPVLSAEEGAEKLSVPQEGQMLKGKYLLIAADVADVHFIQGVLTKGENVYAFSWYVDGTVGDKNIEYTTITYNGAEYEYLLFDDNAGYEAFTYQTHNNGNKTIYVSSTALLFERYGQATEEPSTETHNGYTSSVSSETMSSDTFVKVISVIALFAFVGVLFSFPSFGRKTKIKKNKK